MKLIFFTLTMFTLFVGTCTADSLQNGFMEIINKYFTGLSDKKRLQFESLQELYSEWNFPTFSEPDNKSFEDLK